jgi:predicted pyridoxine 5'-phosphate oxidase superfamily flavin-nucleotide-binding protein
MYHEHSRALQDQFDTRRLADRLAGTLAHSQFTPEDREFIEARSFFFLATVDADGFPECSYKGGAAGFVRIIDEQWLAFPSYDGNGMFKSLGNVRATGKVGLLFMDFDKPKRIRVNGTATVSDSDPLLEQCEGAQLIVRVHAQQIFPNCPRYIPRMQLLEPSIYLPQTGIEAPIPKWKTYPVFNEVLPASDPARNK